MDKKIVQIEGTEVIEYMRKGCFVYAFNYGYESTYSLYEHRFSFIQDAINSGNYVFFIIEEVYEDE